MATTTTTVNIEGKEKEGEGLNKEEVTVLTEKLKILKSYIIEDREIIQKQQKEIEEKDKVLAKVGEDLKNLKKELLVTGGELTESDFREVAYNYLYSIRQEIDFLRYHGYSRTLLKKPLRVAITGAAGRVSYALLSLMATGQTFGMDQPLILSLLEIAPAIKPLQGIAMELKDGGYPLVEDVIITDDLSVAFQDADYAILIGGFSKYSKHRSELLEKNTPVFQETGKALEKHAKETCKVLMVANPANTMCLVCSRYAPKIPKTNFVALTRLDQNRGLKQLSDKLGVPVGAVSNVIIWGNHSDTQVPDVSDAVVRVDNKKQKVEVDEKWVEEEFIPCIRTRAKKVLDFNGFTSASSAANATKDCLRDWHFGTPEGEHVAMGVYSDGSYYGIAKDIFYSFPVTCKNGEISIVSNLQISDKVKALMKHSEQDLLNERKNTGIKD